MWKGSCFILLRDLLEDIKRFCEYNGTEESVITITRTLKKKIIDTFPEEIHCIQMGNTGNTCKSLSIYRSSSERQRFKDYHH